MIVLSILVLILIFNIVSIVNVFILSIEKKGSISPSPLYEFSLNKRPLCQTLSNAWKISKNKHINRQKKFLND